MDLQPGMQVTDNVRLVSLLGKGGMGSVWTADHLSLRTRVAVKFLSAELVQQDPNMLERFNREAALSAKIKSPHVVQTFDHGLMPDGRPYIVMELLDGESLAERLERAQILSLEAAVHVISQTAKALSKAHRLGIVHRDIKPDNIFLTEEDDDEIFVKVLDFGIAKQTGMPQASSVTGTGMMVGTPEYMSPEQVLSARSVDARADLWGLAVVAYHCLTGGVPFTGETLGSLCVAIANGSFAVPSTYRPELGGAVDQWFVKGLAKDADARFASAKELAVSFARVLTASAGVENQFSVSGETAGEADWSGAFQAQHMPGSAEQPGMQQAPSMPASHVSGPGTPAAMASPQGSAAAPVQWPSPHAATMATPGEQLAPPMHGAVAHGAAPAVTHTAPGPIGSPTFAGATVTPDAPRKGRRLFALVAVVAALLLVGTAAAVLISPTDSAPAPAATTEESADGWETPGQPEETASETTSEDIEAAATSEPSAEPAASEEPATAATPAPTRTPPVGKPPVRKPPPRKPPLTKPPPRKPPVRKPPPDKSKDRGF